MCYQKVNQKILILIYFYKAQQRPSVDASIPNALNDVVEGLIYSFNVFSIKTFLVSQDFLELQQAIEDLDELEG